MITFISVTDNLCVALYLTTLLCFININYYTAAGIVYDRHGTCPQLVVAPSSHNTTTVAAAVAATTLWHTPMKATVHYR